MKMKKWSDLILWLLNKLIPNYDEIIIDFRLSDVQEDDEEDIVLANFFESLQKQTDEEVFFNKVTRWLFE